MPKSKPLHPSQKLVTAGEVIQAMEKLVTDLTRAYDQRYVQVKPPE